MHPHNTEMDLSIAYAFYFAARGVGVLQDQNSQEKTVYISPARVLLSGLGADELFAGYTRHAAAFGRMGYPGLLDELELDFNRLGRRNLGRDDRVIAHWGKEVRYPYLDEDFVRWALACPIWEKCGFGRGQTLSDDLEPGKRVLRLLAQELGLSSAAVEKKRAVSDGYTHQTSLHHVDTGIRFNLEHVQPRWRPGKPKARKSSLPPAVLPCLALDRLSLEDPTTYAPKPSGQSDDDGLSRLIGEYIQILLSCLSSVVLYLERLAKCFLCGNLAKFI